MPTLKRLSISILATNRYIVFLFRLLKNLRIIQDGCVPKWIGVKQRASFYIDCAERFNIKGFLSSAEMNIRHINTLAHKLRKHEKDSADAKWGGGAAQVAGGLLGFLGIGK